MHNGHTGEYMNAVLSSHMPLNCNSNIPYYLSDNLQNGFSYFNSDSHELTASGFNTPDNKSPNTSTEQFKNNDEYSHKKNMKYSSRPATARSTEEKFHLETNTPILNPSFKRGNRKKTLSLNPEEREALESLVEDVIIVGLKDAVLDSDESSDESNNDKVSSDALVNYSNTNSNVDLNKESIINNGSAKGKENNEKELANGVNNAKRYELLKENYNTHRQANNNPYMSPNQEAISRYNNTIMNNHNNIMNNNNNQLLSNNRNAMFKPPFNRNSFTNSHNISMKQRDFHLNNFNKPNKDLNKQYFPNNDKMNPSPNNHNSNNSNPSNNHIKNGGEPMILEHNNNINPNNSPNTRQSISNMLSINIYPAQLKVAIKHMDSLPPRFLRRLQTGHNRIGGSEPTLQSISDLNLNHYRHDSSLNSVFPASNQATFSAKTSPIAPSFNVGPLSASETTSACNSVEKDRSKSKQIQLQETKKIIRNLLGDLNQYTDEAINHSGEGGEEEGKNQQISNYQPFPHSSITNASLLSSAFVPVDSDTLFKMNYNRFNSESQLNSLDLQPAHNNHIRGSASFLSDQTRSREFNSLDVAQGSFNYFNKHNFDPSLFYNHNLLQSQCSPLLKKTSLKVDAPIFVSNQFVDKTDSPTTKTRSSDPEITLLPGVLNANLSQQQQPRSIPNKQAPPAVNPAVYPYKMVPSQFYTPMQPSQTPSNQGLYRGFMPMMNYNQPPPFSPAPYHMQYNAYNPPIQPPPSHHQSSMYYPPDYPINQHPYQPWMPSVASGDMFPNNEGNQWYNQNGYMHQYLEQPITGMSGEGAWPIQDGVMSLDEGRQRVVTLVRKGALVMVVFVGATEKLSDLQLGMNGLCVLNLSHPSDHFSQSRFDEHQNWNHQKVTDTLKERKSLVVVDQLNNHSTQLNEYVYMAKCRGYEVVVIKGKSEDIMFGNNVMYSNEAADSNAAMQATAGPAESLEFPSN